MHKCPFSARARACAARIGSEEGLLFKAWWLIERFIIDVMTSPDSLMIVVNVTGYACIILAGYLGYRAVERRLRRRHTVDTLLQLLINTQFAEGVHILDNHIAGDLYVVEAKLKEDDNCTDSKSLDMLMNFYEFMASAYMRNFLDKAVIENQNIKHLHDSFIVLEQLIEERRFRWDRPNYMREFQRLAERFTPKMKTILKIPDPLTRAKMARNDANKSRMFVKPANRLRAVAA
jgi:hypothetical protein